MKKILVVLLLLSMVLFSFGCDSSPAPADDPGENGAVENGDANGVDYSGVKMGIFSNTTAQDGGFGTAMWESVVALKAHLGLSDSQVIWVEGIYDGTEDVYNIIDQLVEEGCNLIVGHSAGYEDQLVVAAQTYPDVYFSGYECRPQTPNAAMYSVSSQQASFLCGYAAARMSEGDELGYVASMPTVSIIRFMNSFAQGARYANENATVRALWTNSWYDPATEKESGIALLERGINSIGYSGSTASVAQACKEYPGSYTTGMYIDMYEFGPDVVLTSTIESWDLMLADLFTMIATDSWSTDNIVYGLAEGAAQAAPLNTGIVPADIAADYEEVKAMVASGEIDVFGGPLFDNQGNQVLQEGETLGSEALLSMNFLVENIIGSIP